jgi:hypothetical protein
MPESHTPAMEQQFVFVSFFLSTVTSPLCALAGSESQNNRFETNTFFSVNDIYILEKKKFFYFCLLATNQNRKRKLFIARERSLAARSRRLANNKVIISLKSSHTN